MACVVEAWVEVDRAFGEAMRCQEAHPWGFGRVQRAEPVIEVSKQKLVRRIFIVRI